jgi:hypothetical protein
MSGKNEDVWWPYLYSTELKIRLLAACYEFVAPAAGESHNLRSTFQQLPAKLDRLPCAYVVVFPLNIL